MQMIDPLSVDSYQSEKDLEDILKDGEKREGIHFEFKREFSDSVKKHLGKHVAAFANSHGGLFGIGVEARDLAVTGFPGIPNIGGLEDTVARKIGSAVNPIPQFRTGVVPVGQNGKVVLLIEVKESLSPPHLYNGIVYIRPAAASEPVRPENRSEIDRMYEKAQRHATRYREALVSTWLKSFKTQTHVSYRDGLVDPGVMGRDWFQSCPTLHLIAYPALLGDEMIRDLTDGMTQKAFDMLRGFPAVGGDKVIISNELRLLGHEHFIARLTREGLVEILPNVIGGENEPVSTPGTIFRLLLPFIDQVLKLYEVLGYSGPFRLVLAARHVKGRHLLMRGGSTFPSEREMVVVEEEVSRHGKNSVGEERLRREVALKMRREFVGNFGVDAVDMAELDRDELCPESGR
jgi:hypothetical protein